MKKLIIIFKVICLLSFSSLSGQNPVTLSIFPDVEITDFNGITHRPYEYLNQGKIVLFDFFSTSCAPCWEYHEEQVLQSIYETFGPDGSDQIMIFIVERNINTDSTDLAGNGTNTFGNFLTCSPYPVIDDHEFAFDMDIHVDQTLLFVCPDKKVTELGQISETELADLINYSCPNPTVQNNLELLYFTCNLEPTCGEIDFIPTVMIQNNGTNTIDNISLQVSNGGQIISDSIGYDLFLEKYETAEIPFNFGDISSTANIVVSLLSVNQEIDTVLEGNTLTGVKEVLQSEDNMITVSISTDNFGYELFWEILDENGLQVAFGGNELVIPGGQQDAYFLLDSPNYYPPNSHHEVPVFLPENGCYTFHIYDDWGDGICCQHGDGKFEILNASGEVLVNNSRFLKEKSVEFAQYFITSNNNDVLSLTSDVSLFPNPTSDLATLTFRAPAQSLVAFDIYDNFGRLVEFKKQLTQIGDNKFQFDFSHLPCGNYFLSNREGNGFKIPFQVIDY